MATPVEAACLCTSLALSCSEWSVFVTLQSVDGGHLKLAQATEVFSNLFTSVEKVLGIEVNITKVTRYGT